MAVKATGLSEPIYIFSKRSFAIQNSCKADVCGPLYFLFNPDCVTFCSCKAHSGCHVVPLREPVVGLCAVLGAAESTGYEQSTKAKFAGLVVHVSHRTQSLQDGLTWMLVM